MSIEIRFLLLKKPGKNCHSLRFKLTEWKSQQDLSFPAENHEQAFASETKTPETINGVGGGHSEGGAEKDANDFSEDDIPF